MKKIIAMLGLMAMSTSTYATLSRTIALGEKSTATYFIEDYRSIFLNPAAANDYGDSLTMEWGSNTAPTAPDEAPRAQGGFLQRSGSLVYGVMLGNETDTGSFVKLLASNNTLTSAGIGGATLNGDTGALWLPTADNVLDVFVAGGNDSLQWGVNLSYHDNNYGNQRIDKGLAIHLGAKMGAMAFYIHSGLMGKTEDFTAGRNDYMDGKLAIKPGMSFEMGASKFYVDYEQVDLEAFNSTVKSEIGYNQITLGWGHTKKVTSSTSVFTKVQFQRLSMEAKMGAQGSDAAYTAELNHTKLPLMIGFEVDAKSWLRLRGSISHNLYGTVKSKNMGTYAGYNAYKKNALKNSYQADLNTTIANNAETTVTIHNSTTVNAGATLLYGNLELDGMIGLANGNRNPTDATAGVGGSSAADESTKKGGVLALDNLMTRVGLTYKF